MDLNYDPQNYSFHQQCPRHQLFITVKVAVLWKMYFQEQTQKKKLMAVFSFEGRHCYKMKPGVDGVKHIWLKKTIYDHFIHSNRIQV